MSLLCWGTSDRGLPGGFLGVARELTKECSFSSFTEFNGVVLLCCEIPERVFLDGFSGNCTVLPQEAPPGPSEEVLDIVNNDFTGICMDMSCLDGESGEERAVFGVAFRCTGIRKVITCFGVFPGGLVS